MIDMVYQVVEALSETEATDIFMLLILFAVNLLANAAWSYISHLFCVARENARKDTVDRRTTPYRKRLGELAGLSERRIVEEIRLKVEEVINDGKKIKDLPEEIPVLSEREAEMVYHHIMHKLEQALVSQLS